MLLTAKNEEKGAKTGDQVIKRVTTEQGGARHPKIRGGELFELFFEK